MSSYPWPVSKERPTAKEVVNPEDINEAARQVTDVPGAVGEHMVSNKLLLDADRITNYPDDLVQGIFWGERDHQRDLEDFTLGVSVMPATVIQLPPNRGWQLVESWSFTVPHLADVIADGSVQLSSDIPTAAMSAALATHPYLSQAGVGLALDGQLCPDFADYGPDKSAEDYQMTQAQATQYWAPYPHGIWRDVPPGEHTIAILVNVDLGQYAPQLSQPLWAWSRNIFVKALYK